MAQKKLVLKLNEAEDEPQKCPFCEQVILRDFTDHMSVCVVNLANSKPNPLKDKLTEHSLHSVYDTLFSMGYTTDLLSECSENDVEELCRVLKLDLIHRLRFKRCLKELNIPKLCNYTVITQKEQDVMNEIDKELQSLSDFCERSALNDETIEHNKKLINCTLDALINMIHSQRKQILMDLDKAYKQKEEQNEHITNCYTDLKEMQIACRSLFISNVDFNKRYQTMLDMKQQWTNKYKTVSYIHKININLKDMCDIRQNIIDFVQVEPQTISLMDVVHNKQSINVNHNNSKQEEKQMDLRQNESTKPLVTDSIDPLHDELVFNHRPARAWRLDSEQNKWRRRGYGELSIYHNNQTNLAKLIFVDEHHNKTRLLQWVHSATQPTQNVEDLTNEEVNITWEAEDYAMGDANPLVGLWKIQFIGALDKDQIANEFINIFNKYNAQKNEDAAVLPLTGELLVKLGWIPSWRKWGLCNVAEEKEDTEAEDDALKVIELQEQTVPDGHEEERLLKRIPFHTLYIFGKDVADEWRWKQRATQSAVGFYQNNNNNLIRMVVREQDTKILRLNHYVPSNEELAQLQTKGATAYQWNANDDTLDPEMNMFCIRFHDIDDAQAFHTQFGSAVCNNFIHQPKYIVIEEEIIEEEGYINLMAPEEEEVEEEEEEHPLFSFAFGANGISKPEKKNVKEEDCPICYENPHKNKALVTKCGHVFCAKCITETISNSPKCPICREECSVDDLTAIIPKEEPIDLPPDLGTFVEDIQQSLEEFESFVDNKTINFGAFMKDIKGFVTTAVEQKDDKQQSNDEHKQTNDEDDASNVTFKGIVHLPEKELVTGHENELLLGSFEICKLYRWARDIHGEKCWKCRATNTFLQFYQHKESRKIRLVSREHITNKLRLNQSVPHMEIAKIKKTTATQIHWVAYDDTLLMEDDTDGGFSCFAAKFNNPESATAFYELFTASSECINAKGLDEEKKVNEKREDDGNKKDDLEINETHVKLEEFQIKKLRIWDEEEWKTRAIDTKLEVHQSKLNGMMDLICRKNENDKTILILHHRIPSLEIASIEQKGDNEVEWIAIFDRVIEKQHTKQRFIATFCNSAKANLFMSYFQAGSMNNSQFD